MPADLVTPLPADEHRLHQQLPDDDLPERLPRLRRVAVEEAAQVRDTLHQQASQPVTIYVRDPRHVIELGQRRVKLTLPLLVGLHLGLHSLKRLIAVEKQLQQAREAGLDRLPLTLQTRALGVVLGAARRQTLQRPVNSLADHLLVERGLDGADRRCVRDLSAQGEIVGADRCAALAMEQAPVPLHTLPRGRRPVPVESSLTAHRVATHRARREAGEQVRRLAVEPLRVADQLTTVGTAWERL